MNNELNYMIKGCVYALLLFVVVYVFYRSASHKKSSSYISQKTVITYHDLITVPEVAAGKILFEKNCTACHRLHATDQFFLTNITDSPYDKKVLYAWIRNSDSVIKSGNVYYSTLYNEYNKTKMTSFPDLTDNEIDEIFDYIKVEKTFQGLPTP